MYKILNSQVQIFKISKCEIVHNKYTKKNKINFSLKN